MRGYVELAVQEHEGLQKMENQAETKMEKHMRTGSRGFARIGQ